MPLQAKRKSAAATRFEADGVWQLASSRVPVRFASRVTALAVLALLGHPAFASWFHGLLILAAAFCICVAELQRETFLARELNHWDEAAAYGILIGAVSLAM